MASVAQSGVPVALLYDCYGRVWRTSEALEYRIVGIGSTFVHPVDGD